ncbi:hypothetical protein L0666_15980 [Octadecabacter sp. CECT 8868]|uniref:hypothetical protein n=1 Tax=Octadecabacter algicola TaxID=2909342 RepID=UPI001F2606F7|nr:hypothetical protein [Octadecabacter algicola]MCF2906492.1 hypothetical protein [Octadecabacter algicola]
MADLTKLSDAVWSVSASQSDNIRVLEDVALGYYPSATFNDDTLQVLQSDWADDAQQYSVHFPNYGRLDSITCMILNTGGIARVNTLITQYGDDVRDHLPPPLHEFLWPTLAEELNKNIISIQICSGTYHPPEDRVNYSAWNQWYDFLELQFQAANMKVYRQTSPSESYLAGFLTAEGDVCEENSCIIAAGPFSVVVPELNTNQATFAVMSVIRP